MSVLHHHRLGSGQSVRDAVLVFVAYGLMRQKDDRDGEHKKNKSKSEIKRFTCFAKKPEFDLMWGGEGKKSLNICLVHRFP